MKERSLYCAFACAALITLLDCKEKPPATHGTEAVPSSPGTAASAIAAGTPVGAEPHAIQSKDEVCNLLTTAEVSEELKKPILPAHQVSIVLDAPTECAYVTSADPGATGFSLRLFFDAPNASALFAHELLAVCGHDHQERLQAIGDDAVLCSKLLVRRGNVFFVLSRLNGDPNAPWDDAARRLATKVVARLP